MWDVYALNRKQNKKNFSKSNGVCVNLLNLGFSSKYLVHVLIVTYTDDIEKILSGQCNNIVYCFKNKTITKKKKKQKEKQVWLFFLFLPWYCDWQLLLRMSAYFFLQCPFFSSMELLPRYCNAVYSDRGYLCWLHYAFTHSVTPAPLFKYHLSRMYAVNFLKRKGKHAISTHQGRLNKSPRILHFHAKLAPSSRNEISRANPA